MTGLRQKLWLGFGGLLAILLTVSAVTFIVLTRYSRTLQRAFSENYDSAVFCGRMNDAINDLNLRLQFLLWQDPAGSAIDARQKIADFDHNLVWQIRNITLPGEYEQTRRVVSYWRDYQANYGRFDALSADGRLRLYRLSLLPLEQQIAHTAQTISEMNMSNMGSVDGQLRRTLVDVRTALLLLAATGVFAAAVVVGAAGASILHPLRTLTRSARQIEAGNLELSLDVASTDEIGQLAEAFNSMAAKLREFRKLDHELLARTQQTTQLAIDSLHDAVFIVGPAGRVEISNRSAIEHFGIAPGSTILSLGEKLKWLPPLYASVKDGAVPPEPQGYASAVQLFDNGQERFLLPRAMPMLDAGQAPIGVIVILVDVTHLRSADEARGGLISTVSHELRTPLTSIRMALSLLTSDRFGPVSAKQSALLTAAREDSERLNRLVDNVLSISRIEAGRAQYQFHLMSPEQIAHQAADPMKTAFAERRINLEVDAAENLPSVDADAVAIGSAVTNLLTNALKFTPAGGTVRLTAFEEDGQVVLMVSDTGPGIPEQYATQIFDKFFRVPRKEGPTGAGLGLAIAKEVVEAHGGTIAFCRDGSIGARFRIALPKRENEPRINADKRG
jgi:NtrC-family two-component system sensor histidine kinase KinB